jgi:flagellar motor switch protein FliN/FliY
MSGLQRSNTVDRVEVEIEVVIGRTRMPIHHLLRMGRGAVIELDSNENDEVEILANGFPVARGQVIVQGKRIQVEVTSLIRRPEVERAIANAAAQAAMSTAAEADVEAGAGAFTVENSPE